MTGKSGAELLQERKQRVADNVALRETDRVPFTFFSTFWATRLGDLSYQDAWYDIDKLVDVMRKAIHMLEPDSFSPLMFSFGPVLEKLEYKPMKWPGKGVGANATFQYIDAEYMRADEYDDYIFDPSGFFQKKYLPRVSGAFEAFDPFPVLAAIPEWSFFVSLSAFADPKLQEGFGKLFEAGERMAGILDKMGAFVVEMESEGYPVSAGGMCKAPYDQFVDFLRGSKGGMLDMFRNKDKLLEAMAACQKLLLAEVDKDPKANNCPYVFIPLHWGLDGFMSPDQFNTFYWPQLREIILDIIAKDLVPCLLWEGDCTSRLEIIGDNPKGKAIYWFERTDLVHAREVLGDTVCLRGNVPVSMLITGTPDDVDEFCRNLIKKVGKGGGLILDGSVGIPDEAKIENVVAMAESVKKYAN